ncbi:SigE family RNA polymerase sigma factor [Kribbella sp. NPDC049227]|uniref:SigE family RNA polymerase sigma factor n=1 Tax=Kribbella sp. NPDC049227 TaxID=3364113 RepID=UPI003715E843
MDRRRRDEDFTAFVEARSASLVRFARVLCGDTERAQDIVQSALEKAYPRWERIEHGDPYGYVRRAVLNHHLSWLRRRPWREQGVGGSNELQTAIERQRNSWDRHVGDHAGSVQHHAAMMAALRTLTKRERAVVVLRYVEDLSEAETAAQLGVAVGTVKSTAARALSKLRESPELTDLSIGGRA